MGVGLALKYYRLKAGTRQKELAQRIGTSPAYLSLIESERRTVNIDLLERIANELSVPVELILLEARQHSGRLSPEQEELLDRVKRLLMLAWKIERHVPVENSEKEQFSKTRATASEYPYKESPGQTTRSETRGSRELRRIRRSPLQPNSTKRKKG